MSELLDLLATARAGDRASAAQLLPLVYDELRKLAEDRLAREPPGHTLQPTALVHEAYLRLVGPADDARWDGRGHFFAAAAEAMRRILIEAARRKHGPQRGGHLVRRDLDLDLDQPGPPERADRLLALDDALERFHAVDARAAQLVKLRYFGGLTLGQAAAALGVSPRTADADWAYARAWLVDALGG